MTHRDFPDVVWPITTTLVHTRGTKTEAVIHLLKNDRAALVLRFGGASDVTINCQMLSEIEDIHRQLGFALDSLSEEERKAL